MAGSPLAAARAVHVALIPEASEIDEDTPILRVFDDLHNLADEDCRIVSVSPRVCHNCGGVIPPCPEHMGAWSVGLDHHHHWATEGPHVATPHVATQHRERLQAKKTTMDAETHDRVLQEPETQIAATPVAKRPAHRTTPWPNPQSLSVTKSKLDQHIVDFPDVEFINASGISMNKRRLVRGHMA